MQTCSASIDLYCLLKVDTSTSVILELFKNLTTIVSPGTSFDSDAVALYTHRKLGRRLTAQALSLMTPPPTTLTTRIDFPDSLDILECVTVTATEEDRTSSILQDEGSPLRGRCAVVEEEYPLRKSAIYFLPDSVGHLVLHLRPGPPRVASVSLDIYSRQPFVFDSVLDVVCLSFAVDAVSIAASQTFLSSRGVFDTPV